MPGDLAELEAERFRLYQELAQIGDFRRGSIAVNYRRCGKPTCACCRPGHRGHGPQYLLMTKVGGQSRAKTLRPGPELEKVEREVANHQRFRAVIHRLVELTERICDARPVAPPSAEAETAPLKKKLRRRSATKSPRK